MRLSVETRGRAGRPRRPELQHQRHRRAGVQQPAEQRRRQRDPAVPGRCGAHRQLRQPAWCLAVIREIADNERRSAALHAMQRLAMDEWMQARG